MCLDLAGTRAIAAIAGQVFQAIQALGRQAGRAIQGRQVLAAGQAKLGRQGLQVGLASQALAVIAGQGFQGILAIAGQERLVGQAIQGRQGRQGRQGLVAGQAKLGHQGLQAGRAIVVQVYLAIQVLAGLEPVVGRAFLAGQDLAEFRAGRAKWGRQGRQVGRALAVRLGHQGRQVGRASAGSVAIAGQEFQGTRVSAGTQASKGHRSISKAQWPHQPICQRQATIPMMHTLLHPMAICTFGVERPGTMLAK